VVFFAALLSPLPFYLVEGTFPIRGAHLRKTAMVCMCCLVFRTQFFFPTHVRPVSRKKKSSTTTSHANGQKMGEKESCFHSAFSLPFALVRSLPLPPVRSRSFSFVRSFLAPLLRRLPQDLCRGGVTRLENELKASRCVWSEAATSLGW